MPRAAKSTGSRKHASAVAIPKRAFAVPDDQVTEHVLPGAPAPDLESATAALPHHQTKKEKQAEKHANRPVFHGAVVAGVAQHPYSRSHIRREKRKANQQLAGGLGSISLALAETVGEVPIPTAPVPSTRGKKRSGASESEVAPQHRKREADGKIGEGSAHTMGERQRRKQIASNATRIPAVMAHPAFKANPWATIREHATNSLALADTATSLSQRKAAAAAKAAAHTPITMQGIE